MASRYWVAGSGNWSDNTNHWSASSGGAAGASKPTSADAVLFDASSFSGAGQTVTVDETSSCLSMDWTGATNSPTLAYNAALSFYGNVTFITAMNITGSGDFISAGAGNTLTMAGQDLTNRLLVNSGVLTLLDTFLSSGFGDVTMNGGTLDTNGQTVTTRNFVLQGATGKTLTMGASTINCAAWNYSGTNLTLTANTATINVSGTGAGAFGNVNYNGATFNFNGTAHTLSGSPTGIAALNFKPSGAQTITATGTTQTVATASRTGTGLITIVGGTWVKTGGGIIVLNRLSISNSTAMPGSTWYAVGSTNGGGNSGWVWYQQQGIVNKLVGAGVI
ncbi:MAG: hypothetical protein Q8O55_00705 [Dehalococcoidales bacterium]|nr:hypothetical protein [Dehalococcoidales bacterium]